ncbi:MAG: beta-carotene hydroxylase [Candidatus Pseudothioglobus sp.]
MGKAMTTVTNTALEWDTLSPAELDAMERKIAGKYMHKVPWVAVVWGLLNCMMWLMLWPLVMLDIMPLWVGFPLATLNVMLCYLPSHEAQHNIIARKGHPLRWLNELVGHVSVIPLQAFRVLRYTHFEHHHHTNDPALDPDYSVHATNNFAFFKNSLMRRQPGSLSAEAYPAALQRTGMGHIMIDALLYNLAYFLILFSMAWSGYAIEVALLWWLPKHIASTYIQYYLSWAPHHPGLEQGRYRETRAFKSYLGNIWSMGMQYHIIHHLYPRIPLSKTPAAFRELQPILARKGCEFGGL